MSQTRRQRVLYELGSPRCCAGILCPPSGGGDTPESPSAESGEPEPPSPPSEAFFSHYRRGEKLDLDEATARGLIDYAMDAYEKEQRAQGEPEPKVEPEAEPKAEVASAPSDAALAEIRKLRQEVEQDRQARQQQDSQKQMAADMERLCKGSKFLGSEPQEQRFVESETYKAMWASRGHLPMEKAFQQVITERQTELAARDERILGSKVKQASQATEAAGGGGAPSTGRERPKANALRDKSIMERVAQRFREARSAG